MERVHAHPTPTTTPKLFKFTKAPSLYVYTTTFPCITQKSVKPQNKLKLSKNKLKNELHEAVLYQGKSLVIKLSIDSSDWQWLSKVSKRCLAYHLAQFNLERPGETRTVRMQSRCPTAIYFCWNKDPVDMLASVMTECSLTTAQVISPKKPPALQKALITGILFVWSRSWSCFQSRA